MARRGGRRGRRVSAHAEVAELEKAEHAFAVYSDSYNLYDQSIWESEANKGDVYKDSVWAFVAIRAIAIAAASIRWALKKRLPGPGPDEELFDHPLLTLIKKPNPHFTRYDLVEELIWQYSLEGSGYVEMVPSRRGAADLNRRFRPVALYTLKSKHVSPIPDPKTRVLGYNYSPNGDLIRFNPWEIIQVRAYNPENDTDGYSAFNTARNSVDVDRDTQVYSKKFFQNGAFPSATLETDRILPKPLQQRVQSEWKSKFGIRKNPHEVALLMAGLKYKPISFTFRDMDFEKLRKLSREEILATADVPPLIVGLLDGSSWANAHQQKLDFVTNTVGPILRKIFERFNMDLASRFGKDLYFEPDYVSYLRSPEQDEGNERRARAMFKDGLITRDEARDMAGFGPASDGGDLFVDDLRDLRNTGSNLRARSSPSQSMDGEERPLSDLPDSPSRAPDVENRPRNRFDLAFDVELREYQRGIREGVYKLRDKYKEDLTTCLYDMFSAQSRSCVEKLMKADGDEFLIESVFDDDLYSYLSSISSGYVNGFVGVLLPLAKEAAELTVSSLLGYESVSDSSFVEELYSSVTRAVNDINRTTTGRVAKSLESGKTVSKGEAQTLVVSTFEECAIDKSRLRTAVDSEITRAVNLGVQAALEANGWIAKTWVCGSGDSRDSHAAMNGVTVEVSECFSVDGESLLYPGDYSGSAKNICGCTCTIVPGVPSDLNKYVEHKTRQAISKPYSGPDDSSLPKDIKRLPKDKREVFVATFNSVLSDSGDEGKAFRVARAAAIRKDMVGSNGRIK